MVKTEVANEPENSGDFPKLFQHDEGCVVLATAPNTGMCIHGDWGTPVGEWADNWSFEDDDWCVFEGCVKISGEIV